MIKCSVCKKTYRHICVNITIDELNILTDQEKGYSWSCKNCREIGNQIIDLKNLILSLQNDIKALKDEKISQKSSREFDFEEVIMELNDRSIRKKNIIIFGLPEQDQTGPAENRLQKDKTAVSEVLKVIDANVNTMLIKPTRLGRFTNNKARPLKITLQDELEVLNVIKKARNLKNSPYKNVSVAFDRTQRQIDHYKKLQEEMKSKNSGDTQEFKIRYFNGSPKIVRALN